MKKYSHWSSYVSTTTPTVCFVVSQPTAKAPKGVNRDPVYFYITRYPSEGIKNEISVKMGYPFSAGARVNISVGSTSLDLYTKDEGAFVETRAQEDQLVAAMKAGSTMTITGTSSRGTKTTDTYSLSGVTDALNSLGSGCGS